MHSENAFLWFSSDARRKILPCLPISRSCASGPTPPILLWLCVATISLAAQSPSSCPTAAAALKLNVAADHSCESAAALTNHDMTSELKADKLAAATAAADAKTDKATSAADASGDGKAQLTERTVGEVFGVEPRMDDPDMLANTVLPPSRMKSSDPFLMLAEVVCSVSLLCSSLVDSSLLCFVMQDWFKLPGDSASYLRSLLLNVLVPTGGFPSHPHRGFETVTLILSGELEHKDSKGNSGVLKKG
jgi:hypothetical protein